MDKNEEKEEGEEEVGDGEEKGGGGKRFFCPSRAASTRDGWLRLPRCSVVAALFRKELARSADAAAAAASASASAVAAAAHSDGGGGGGGGSGGGGDTEGGRGWSRIEGRIKVRPKRPAHVCVSDSRR